MSPPATRWMPVARRRAEKVFPALELPVRPINSGVRSLLAWKSSNARMCSPLCPRLPCQFHTRNSKSMTAHVLSLGNHFQVCRGIVRLVSIAMMNDLASEKLPPEHLFGNYPVFVSAHAFYISVAPSTSALQVATLGGAHPRPSAQLCAADRMMPNARLRTELSHWFASNKPPSALDAFTLLVSATVVALEYPDYARQPRRDAHRRPPSLRSAGPSPRRPAMAWPPAARCSRSRATAGTARRPPNWPLPASICARPTHADCRPGTGC